MKPLTTPIADPSRTDAKYQALLLFDDELMEENKDEIFNVVDEMDEEVQPTDEEETHVSILTVTQLEVHASVEGEFREASYCVLTIGTSMKKLLPLMLTSWLPLKHVNFDLKTAGDHRKLQLNELNELRDQAYENSFIYKERTKKLHDDKIKNRIFNVGDQVLLFNSRLKIFSGKLKSHWSGPFTISKIYPYETAKLIHPDGCNFKVNCHRLKHYHGGDPPPLEIPDVTTFPKDN
nr:reverse transcriptase domain-containing protein [Tanacetum cinerariifolium]